MPGSVTVDQVYHTKLDVAVADSEVLPTFRKHQRKPTNEETYQAEDAALRRAKDAVSFLQSSGNPKAHHVQSAADRLVEDIDRARNFRACWGVSTIIDESTCGVFGDDGESVNCNVAEINTVAVESRDLRKFENKLLSELRGIAANLSQTPHGKEIGGAARKYTEALAKMRGQSVPFVEKESGIAKSPELMKLWKVLLEELKREAQWFERQESRLYGGPVAQGVAALLMSAYQKFEAALKMIPGIKVPAPTRNSKSAKSPSKSSPTKSQNRAMTASPKPQSAKAASPQAASRPVSAPQKQASPPIAQKQQLPAPQPSGKQQAAPQPQKQQTAPPTQNAGNKPASAQPPKQQAPTTMPATNKQQVAPQPQKQQAQPLAKAQQQPSGQSSRPASSKPSSSMQPPSASSAPAPAQAPMPKAAAPRPQEQKSTAAPSLAQQQQLTPPASKQDRARSPSPKPAPAAATPKMEGNSRPSSAQSKPMEQKKSGAGNAPVPAEAESSGGGKKGGKKGKKN
ncbi:hypothetical protein HDU93_004868 [Gonapodya sp. JEL0774]|nr:hypothetical protein HDU93_004868 [Gonapodya sp. JEL0774]